MIYTITLNPALDFHVDAGHLEIGKLNRSKTSVLIPGGKGINVSIMLSRFGVPTTASGFLGGFTGNHIRKTLQSVHGIDTDFVMIDGSTRINIKLRHDGVETEVNQDGPVPTPSEVRRLLDRISMLDETDIVVLSGAPAKGALELVGKIAKSCHDRHLKFVVDTSGKSFVDALPYQPYLVKPNIHELEEFAGKTLGNLEEIVSAGKDLLQKGAQYAIVSLGSEGSLFFSQNEIYRNHGVSGHVVSTIGSGDSMVAAFLIQKVKGASLQESYKLAVAAGSATAFTEGIATKAQVESILPLVEIDSL